MTSGSLDVTILVPQSKFYFPKMILRPPSFQFWKSTINYLSNKWSTASIGDVIQNIWTFPFFTKIIEIMTSFYKNYVIL